MQVSAEVTPVRPESHRLRTAESVLLAVKAQLPPIRSSASTLRVPATVSDSANKEEETQLSADPTISCNLHMSIDFCLICHCTLSPVDAALFVSCHKKIKIGICLPKQFPLTTCL